jgi:hypothetical protein
LNPRYPDQTAGVSNLQFGTAVIRESNDFEAHKLTGTKRYMQDDDGGREGARERARESAREKGRGRGRGRQAGRPREIRTKDPEVHLTAESGAIYGVLNNNRKSKFSRKIVEYKTKL